MSMGLPIEALEYDPVVVEPRLSMHGVLEDKCKRKKSYDYPDR